MLILLRRGKQAHRLQGVTELMLFDGKFLEFLLSVILMFNVGAYSFLWYKIRRLEQDKVSDLEERLSEKEEVLNNIWNRIFGYGDDPTMEGHLVETEDRFDSIDEKLQEIANTMQEMSKGRKREHREVRKNFSELIRVLSEEENLEFDRETIDFEMDRKY